MAFLQQNGRANVETLAKMFATTPQTIRKDLAALADANRVVRFHGGASLLAGVEYLDFQARNELAQKEKDMIGRAVAQRIPNNAAVLINSGTTTRAVARHLRHHAGLKVLTDSVLLANEIREFPGVEVLVPSGSVRRSDGAILGETAIDFVRQFRADIAVIGAAAIAPDGALLDFDLREASMTRAIVENARAVILAADSSKFGSLAPIHLGHLSQMRELVIDHHCPPALRTLCRTHGVEVTLVG